jgi:N-acetylmuramate 1-kinase
VTSLPTEAARYADEWLGPGWTAQALAGDASIRAYYRIRMPDGSTYILAWYPQEVRNQLTRFMRAYEAVGNHGRVPEVLRHCDVAVLQKDVGDRTLFDVLHENRAEGVRLYEAAIDLLAGFQRAGDNSLNPPFTAEFFFAELEMAREYYVEKLMGGEGSALRPLFQEIAHSIAAHPYVLCHRDYHGQNIHIDNGTLFVIDYQDLRMGPDTYDLASLLRDRGVARILGGDVELELIEHYRVTTRASGDVRRRYFETLLQRSIKILGTFASQPIVRGRFHYLEFIPPALESVRRCLDELPHFSALRDIVPFDFAAAQAAERARELNQSGN